MGFHIGLMGPIVATRGDDVVTPTPPKLRQLLALLALEDGAVVPSEVIAQELWSSGPSPRSARIVQTYVSQLRGLLDGGPPRPSVPPIRNVPRVGYRLALDGHGTCDVHRVQDLAARASERLVHGDKEGGAALFQEAFGLCRGRPLSGVPVGPVLGRRRKRLEALRMNCFEQLMRLLVELGRGELALTHYERVLAEDVQHEPLYAHLLAALASTGRGSTAVELFHEVRRDIVARTGMEPGEMLRQTFLAVVQNAGAPSADRTAPAQLPLAPRAFVGFASELAAARRILARSDGPAVTVIGGPGSGRTTFCTQLAHQVRGRYPGGQLHADLSERGVPDTLREFISAVGGDGRPLPGSPVERSRLFRHLTAQAPVLVLLDNVADVEDVRLLQPGGRQGSMILACRRRCWADFVTGTVELRAADEEELTAMLVARIGADAVAREPAAARSVVALASGLPVAIDALTALLRSRPHWTLRRLVDRMTGEMGGRIALVIGAERLDGMVESTLELVPAATRDALLRMCRHARCAGPFSVGSVADALGLSPEDAEQVIEAAVAVRIADPVDDRGRYALNALHRAAVLEWSRRRPPAGGPP